MHGDRSSTSVTAQFLDDLEDKYGDEGTLSAVLTIVVIDHGRTRAWNTGRTTAPVTDSRWQTKGLLAVVGDDIQGSVRREHD